ncbi:MAG: ABC transport system substrate-binding protein [Ignavibacteria bacterium]|nr:MAG: ABC transport system substrate-binding protein [Ignavibacteria bacterium]KAF0160499.1 MAG: ABC transport system substrate-binding protein [Ignavibacteria bacterium]
MLKQLEGARLGIFIFLGTVLLVMSIFLLGSKEKLFTSTIEIKTYFDQIEGLKPGAPVRLSGYNVGSVQSISLESGSLGRVEVILNIDDELKKFIRLDSRAAIETEGLVGKKIVTISPGSPDKPEIESGGVIPSKNPVNVSAIIEETQAIMSNIKSLSKEFSETFAKINKGEGSIGKLVYSEDLYNSTVTLTQSADKSLNIITKRLDEISDIIVSTSGGVKKVIDHVDTTIIDARKLLKRIDRGDGVLGKLIGDSKMADSIVTVISNLSKTSEFAKYATISFAENMEALKHNWLFKSYFEQRGYWSQTDYEKALNAQIDELKKQQSILETKMKELNELETKLKSQKK